MPAQQRGIELGRQFAQTLGMGEQGFDFAGAWTVREQNQLLALCFGLPLVNKA